MAMGLDLRGVLYVLIASTMWGLIGTFTKLLLAEGLGSMEIAFWRATLGWVLFATHAGIRRRVGVDVRDLPALLAFGLLCVTVFYGSYQVAIRDLGVAPAVVLLYTAPAWVALLAWLMLRETMGLGKIAGVVMTIAGVAALSLGPAMGTRASLSLGLVGLIAGLLSGLTYALYYIFGKRYLPRYATETLFVYALPVGAVGLLPFVEFAPKSAGTWLLLVVFAAVSTYGAFSVYYAGLRRLEATRAAIIATFEPVVGVTAGVVLFGEYLGVWGFTGSALIVAAVVLVVRTGDRANRLADADASTGPT